jgi:hypothetical protein
MTVDVYTCLQVFSRLPDKSSTFLQIVYPAGKQLQLLSWSHFLGSGVSLRFLYVNGVVLYH